MKEGINMLRSGNPALTAKTFEGLYSAGGRAMTIDGTVNKTAILLFIVLATASVSWSNALGGAFSLLAGVGAFGGFIVGLVTAFKKEWAPFTAPLYAALEGLFLGAISVILEQSFPGIVLQAVGLTFGTLFALLVAYKSGLIQATENFKLGVVAATGGIALLYLVSFVLSFFNIRIPFIHEGGTYGIIFSAIVVVIAALNLVLDFDFIEQGARDGAPSYMEWYGAFGLMVTLIWLYIEILRLLAKLRSSRD
jgi:uncharacterized YccA/Bax inhibitor family protein